MKVLFSPRVRRDLKEIIEYIAQSNPPAARRIRTRIEQSIIILKHHPELGRQTHFVGVRKWQIPGLPYAAYYNLGSNRIWISRIVHGARQWPESVMD
ncbi:MAG: type II toxin-antitoxin system RelE/ParE family toxin [Alphaproteobacteria bacterium]|nr:type II toxin-antitoxin system RelE/ParE family toxin [Alphaproteobacteria bacterium]